MKTKITSLDNKKIKGYISLLQKKYRDKTNLFIVEGSHLVQEAIKHNQIVEVLTSTDVFEGTLVSDKIIKRLSTSKSPQPVVGICKKRPIQELGPKVVALNNVQDPSNVGAIIRTARAFGFSDVIVQGADFYNPKSLRASQGSIFSINVIQTTDISTFFGNYELVGAVVDKGAMIYDQYHPSESFMLILGSEGLGIQKTVHELLDHKVYIPIEFESLNVGAAAAILINRYSKLEDK